MYWFGNYAMLAPTLFAVAGVALGCLLNWVIGAGLAMVRARKPDFLPDAQYGRAQALARRWGVWLLPFVWAIPLGAILPLLAGFFHVRWWLAAVLVAAGYAAHLFYQLAEKGLPLLS